MLARKVDSQIEQVTRQVTLKGIRPIMFDRYAGDNQTKLLWTQRVYLIQGKGSS